MGEGEKIQLEDVILNDKWEQLKQIYSVVHPREYNRVVAYAIRLGVENGFIQEGATHSESFIPSFDHTGL